MTPVEASRKKNEGILYFNLNNNTEPRMKSPQFKASDKVRISKYKRKVFDKGKPQIGPRKYLQSIRSNIRVQSHTG